MPAIKERKTAHKVWIKDLLANKFVKQEGWDPSYVEIGGEQVSRVNLLATAVGKFLAEDGHYGAITLDDGSETIRAKAFGPDVPKLKLVEVGHLVRLIGKPKEYNDEVYLSPEIVRVEDDPNWLLVQKLELGEQPKAKVKAGAQEKEAKAEVKAEEPPSAKIMRLIREWDVGDGASTEEVIKQSGLDEADAKNLISSLLNSGDAFEPKKGKLKLLE